MKRTSKTKLQLMENIELFLNLGIGVDGFGYHEALMETK